MKKQISGIVFGEPLVPILIIGALLFLGYSAFSPDTKEVIEVNPEVVQGLVRNREMLVGRPLTSDEGRVAVEAYIDDEVLLREAYKRGFDRSDPRVRKRLLSVMRYTLDENIPEPSVAQLQAYYKSRKDKYQVDESITFDQVYFSLDSEKTPEDHEAFLEKITKAENPSSLGDRPFLGATIQRKLTKIDLARQFGRPFADKVFDLRLDKWSGPFESKQGTHYVRLKERHPPYTPPFENLEYYVRKEWELDKRKAIQDKKIAEMRKRYRIMRPDLEKQEAQ